MPEHLELRGLKSVLASGVFRGVLYALSLLAGLFLLSAASRRLRTIQGKPDATARELFFLVLANGLVGLFVVLNQFGPALAKLFATRADLQIVSFAWNINSLVPERLTYAKILLFLLLLALGVTATASATNGGRRSFLQGLLAGFLFLPSLAAASALAALVFYLLSFVLRFIFYLIGLILIPIIWLYQHVLRPLVHFLAIPFIWLWDHALREIVLFLSIPFVWLWKTILHPLGAFLLKYLLSPLFFLALAVVIATACIFPFALIGEVALQSIRSSFRDALDSKGLFCQGVTTGFLLLDAVILAALTGSGALHATLPLTLALPAALLMIVLIRLIFLRDQETIGASQVYFQENVNSYWRSSGLELISVIVIPLSLAASFYTDES